MNKKEETIALLTMGRNSLITAILTLREEFYVHELEDLRDEVNRRIKALKEIE